MSIFNHLDYRTYLKEALKVRKRDEPSFTLTGFAQAAGIRNTYLNNVIHAGSNLNSDQVYALAKQLNLSSLETRYFFMLKELDQTTLTERRENIRREIEQIQQQAKRSESHISAKLAEEDPASLMKYYGNPLNKIVHIMAQIPRFAEDPSLIAPALSMTQTQCEGPINTLIELGILRYKQKTLEVLKKNYHLPKESPMLLPHQALMRMKSSEHFVQLSPENRYSFSVTLSTDDETRKWIHAKFLEFLKQIEPKVKESNPENAYQLNFDLFSWSTFP